MSKLQLADFFYELPEELIAQKPLSRREASRLLVLDKKSGQVLHDHFYNIGQFLKSGDVLVLNNSKVFPARLKSYKKNSGGRIEIFLLKKIVKEGAINTWECLIKGKVKAGLQLIVSDKLKALVLSPYHQSTYLVEFNLEDKAFWQAINKHGTVPLPPYIKRNTPSAFDKLRYQTVYADAKQAGSVAAPTAGLHFSKGILEKLRARGVIIKYLTLHVGLGTFLPVKTEKIEDHLMHSEYLEIKKDVLETVLVAKEKGKKVIAVGTTSCRALEAAAGYFNISRKTKKSNLNLRDDLLSLSTDIFIYPGYSFKLVDALITNFHLPKSSLLMLVSALATKENIDKAYQEAIEKRYRFFSYGDAMLII